MIYEKRFNYNTTLYIFLWYIRFNDVREYLYSIIYSLKRRKVYIVIYIVIYMTKLKIYEINELLKKLENVEVENTENTNKKVFGRGLDIKINKLVEDLGSIKGLSVFGNSLIVEY